MAENVDTKALDEIAANLQKAKRQLVGRLAERGYQLLRQEVPKRTRNLMQGVAAPDVDYDELTAVLTVSARSARTGSRSATVIGADGQEKKKVSLKAQPAYNYAAAVALGRPAIAPKNGKALLIPVPAARAGEGYLLVGGQVYIVRRSAKATKPNPFHERAAKRLETEAPAIGTKVLEKYF